MQVGPYAYRVLRPARALRGAVLTRSGELRVIRRDALRMLALAELVAGRTLVAFPLRDERGIPYDLVLAPEELRFPAARWSDVRQRLGPGRIERHARPAAAGAPSRSKRRAEATRHALLVPMDAQGADLARARRGDSGVLRVALV